MRQRWDANSRVTGAEAWLTGKSPLGVLSGHGRQAQPPRVSPTRTRRSIRGPEGLDWL